MEQITRSRVAQTLPRIMVVDDEPDITYVMKRVLEKNGLQVDGFTDPEEALRQFTADKYAMVITDIRMPKMNGFDLYRELLKIESDIKVAFMTAYDVYINEFNKVLPSVNAEFFFKKPVGTQKIIECVKQVTDREFR